MLKVEAMPDQENQVDSVEWAESLVWAQAGSLKHLSSHYKLSIDLETQTLFMLEQIAK